METKINTLPMQERLAALFHDNQELIGGNAPARINELRKEAMERFQQMGFPTTRNENWRFTDLTPLMKMDYDFDFENQSRSMDVENIFKCDVYDLDTFSVTMLNGWYVYKNAPLTRLPDGTIIGSLAKAMEVYPDLVDQYLGKAAHMENNSLTALNTAFMQDGLFIYVPQGVQVEKPIQLVNIVDTSTQVFLNPRHLIIVEKEARLTLVHCDHSLTHNVSFTNTVSEIFTAEAAYVDHYKIQNKGRNSGLVTSTYFNQKKDSEVHSNIITLNGGFTKNIVEADLTETGCHSDISGLYLVDSNQHIDNQVAMNHHAPDCTSNQLYKGILDDQARAVFSGKVKVHRLAQKTQAFQNNRNILLTDDAKANTQPHLEIYADDVKCSHGATVGQLDLEAMFYMRSRGLSERAARQLMMFAFAHEVVEKIAIEVLAERLDQLIEKRLKGELTICDQCMLHCNSKEPTTFNIDISKL
ncbi:MAG: Fe-S cluster assembly protein SufD [Bacteroidales bacterium]